MPCPTPPINITYTDTGLVMDCTENATCAWVRSEIESCTCGKQWSNTSHMLWQDPRFKECTTTKQYEDYANVHGIIRWWYGSCMGHYLVNLKFILEPTFRDIYMTFEEINIDHYVIVETSVGIFAKAKSGSEDEIPIAGKSEMFFECVLNKTTTGVHMEIMSCDIEILESGKTDAEILRTLTNIQVNTSYADPNGERATYRAFMDDDYYSPWQRLLCTYALFNGTTSIEQFSHNKSYMLLNPFDTGIIQT